MRENKELNLDKIVSARPILRYDILYPLIGATVALGSPAGMLLIRFCVSGQTLSWLWSQQEIGAHVLFYGYITVGTAVTFGLFGYFAGQLAQKQWVDNSFLRHRSQQLQLNSVKDSLTGAYSHAYMMEHLQLEMEKTKRSRRPLCIAMLDVDNFKEINDRHGHLFGDHVLVSLVETMRKNIRAKDIICRYGGDEFLIIMSDTSTPDAKRFLERVMAVEADLNLNESEEMNGPALKDITVTVSVGLASFRGSENVKPVDLLSQADAKLYEAKRAGKNTIAF